MQEVSGSIPLGSTIHLEVSPMAIRWLTRFRPPAFLPWRFGVTLVGEVSPTGGFGVTELNAHVR
jgi:hypothetical protein